MWFIRMKNHTCFADNHFIKLFTLLTSPTTCMNFRQVQSRFLLYSNVHTSDIQSIEHFNLDIY